MVVPFARALVALFALSAVRTALAQCEKPVVITSSKTEYLNGQGDVQRTVEEDCTIRIDKGEVNIAPAGHEAMIGKVTSVACAWTEPFKTGKTTVEATFKDGNGAESPATISIEGKAGKFVCLMKEKAKPDRAIRVVVEKFEEQASGRKP